MKKIKSNKVAKQTRKLTLARHTLRQISRDALADVGGGTDGGPSLDTCWSDCC